MRAETAIIAAYAALAIGLALGLHRIGRMRVSPWTSRVLAGHRRVSGDEESVDQPDWPGSESQRIHTVVALVATVAATVLPAVELFRHHHVSEVVVLGAVMIAGVLTATHLRRDF